MFVPQSLELVNTLPYMAEGALQMALRPWTFNKWDWGGGDFLDYSRESNLIT